MAERIHHINFIVRDLEKAVAIYERILDTPATARDHLESRGVISARFCLGETWLVLVQPVQADSVPGRFLEQNGEGFFLMSLEVDSLEREIERLGEGAFDGEARQGMENWRVIDLDATLSFGAQLQLTEEKER